MKLHELCRQERRKREMSQSRLAEYTGTTQSTIANFEAGRTGISSKLLEQILNTLGLDVSKHE